MPSVPNPSNQPVESDQFSIGNILLQENLINSQQFENLKLESAKQNTGVDELIRSLHLVPDDKFYEAQAKMLNVPFTSVGMLPFSPEALGFIPKSVAERFKLIPFAFDKEAKILSVVMGNANDVEATEFVKQKTGASIKVFQGIPEEISQAIETQYSFGLVGEVQQALKETEKIEKVKTIDLQNIAEVIKDAPIAKIVTTILEYAVKSRASDIHLEPLEDRVRLRYRIDGILYERLSLPLGVSEAVISRIKILCEMKIDEHRVPQDGRFNFKVSDQEVDLRVSSLPTTFGEKIVMRLLRKSDTVPTLNDLGLAGPSLRTLEAAMLRPHGIILVCGPTGSGKTTTLYAVLSKLNTTRVNILTLEDPVEYVIPGANQVQINDDVGLSFAAGLRSFLRQDPNIILVGEIRDKETTELAIQASLTGHLVFSTLHTSNAAGALPRLIDMGAETFLIASTINAAVGQRIARKICSHCRVDYIPPSGLVDEMRKVLGPLMPRTQGPVKVYKGSGCEVCGHSGFLGRVGIFEVMAISDEIAKLILSRSDSASIEAQAVKDGMITMKQDGYLKVITGVTTIDEILRVAQE